MTDNSISVEVVMLLSFIVLTAVQAASPAQVAVAKPKAKACSVVQRTGSRLRPVSRCVAPKRDPKQKVEKATEPEEEGDFILEQDRLGRAACMQSANGNC